MMWILFLLILLFPSGVIVAAIFGYVFELISVSGVALGIALFSVCTVIFDLVFKPSLNSKLLSVVYAVISPLSLISAVFYVFGTEQILVVVSVFATAGCCFFLSVRHGKPFWLKEFSFVLSFISIIPILFITLVSMTLGDFSQVTVVKTVESPEGKYYANVVDVDQGALGGNTLVEVDQIPVINAFLFKIRKEPIRVYTGDWGEYKNLQIYWKNDNCLVINSEEHLIE